MGFYQEDYERWASLQRLKGVLEGSQASGDVTASGLAFEADLKAKKPSAAKETHCQSCGARLNQLERFCGHCGTFFR